MELKNVGSRTAQWSFHLTFLVDFFTQVFIRNCFLIVTGQSWTKLGSKYETTYPQEFDSHILSNIQDDCHVPIKGINDRSEFQYGTHSIYLIL